MPVAILADETTAVMEDNARCAAFDKVHIGLDFSDGSINRIAVTAIGGRSAKEAILPALLEEVKGLPFGFVRAHIVSCVAMSGTAGSRDTSKGKRICMKKIKIKNTDLELGALGFGTVNAGLSWDHEEAFWMFENYLAAGGNLIDTAHVYSDWIPGEIARAERVVGEWIRNRKRTDDFVLMTKGGHPRNETMHISRLSRAEMETDLDASLQKLGVDCVDIYFFHRDDVNRPVEELIETMEDFKRAGKIRYYGCSNWTTARMKAADRYCRAKGYRGFVANQDMFNIGVKHMKPFSDLTMVVCDDEMLRYHRESDNLLMPYMGVCSGFFHNLRTKGIEAVKESCYHTASNLEIASHIYKLCERKDYTVTQALLGFFEVQDFDVLPLASADNREQFAELSRALGTGFDVKDYEFLK